MTYQAMVQGELNDRFLYDGPLGLDPEQAAAAARYVTRRAEDPVTVLADLGLGGAA